MRSRDAVIAGCAAAGGLLALAISPQLDEPLPATILGVVLLVDALARMFLAIRGQAD